MKIRLINMAKGMLVLPDLNNQHHVNIPAQGHHDFTEREFFYYRKNAETRIRNKLLKMEMVADEEAKFGDEASTQSQKELSDQLEENIQKSLEDVNEESDYELSDDEIEEMDEGIQFTDEELKQMDEEAKKKVDTQPQSSKKKKKKKNRNK